MEVWTIIASVFGVIGTLAAIVFAYQAYLRGKGKESADAGENKGAVLTELGYIKGGIDDIKRKQEKQDEQYIQVISRLCAVESSAKQAHKRLDEFIGHAKDD